MVPAKHHEEWIAKIDGWREETRSRDILHQESNGRLLAAHVINDLWKTTGGDAIVVSDVGQHQMFEAQYYKHDRPRTLITSGGLGTMGFALPAAIGAKMARPEAEVWVVAGDGGFQMTACELTTIMQEKLDIKIAVINNGFLGMVRQWQEFFHDKRYAATPMLSPDFVALAAAHGVPGHRVTERADVAKKVEEARSTAGPDAPGVHGAEGGGGLPDGPGRQRSGHDDPPAERDGRRGEGMKHTLVAKVADQPGVLNRVASLFRRRAFNIDSLTVGHTEVDSVSRMTIVVDTARVPAHIVEANLRKLVPVMDVTDVTHTPTVDRDLALIRVNCSPAERAELASLVEIFRGRIVDVARESVIVEVTGHEQKVNGLVDLLKMRGIVEMVRTGKVAMVRGSTKAESPEETPDLDATPSSPTH